MQFHLTSGNSRGYGYGYGYGTSNGEGYGWGFGTSNGEGYGWGYSRGYGYSFGYDNGCAKVNSGIHPRISADPDLRVAIQTAALQLLLHIG